jgi:hypothetical protein
MALVASKAGAMNAAYFIFWPPISIVGKNFPIP